MNNNYSEKYNKYQQKYIESQSGGYRYRDYPRREENYNDYHSSGGNYDEEHDGGYDRYTDYHRRDSYDNYSRGGYDGGKYGITPRDPINDVIKKMDNELWRHQDVKGTRKIFDQNSEYITYSFNWALGKGPVYAYIISLNNIPISLHIIYCENESSEISNEIPYCRIDNKMLIDDEPKGGYFLYRFRVIDKISQKHAVIDKTNWKLNNRTGKLERPNNYIPPDGLYYDEKTGRLNLLRNKPRGHIPLPLNGGYEERYIDNYYPRDRYRDDYYPNSMHGGALGEFRKEINREIL
jgi:hypothetical protein